MTTATTPVYVELPPTATYRRRRAGWFPGAGEHTDGRIGTLRIVCQFGKRPADRDHVDEYGVATEPHFLIGFATRYCAFVLTRDGATDPTVYRCGIRPDVPGFDLCTCPAGAAKTPCKHAASVRALLNAGVL